MMNPVERERHGSNTARHVVRSHVALRNSQLSHWSSPASAPRLADSVVHVWRASLRVDVNAGESLSRLLAADESDRAASYHFDRDRQAYIAARGTLRLVLSRYVGVAAEDVEFRYGEHGKPELAQDSGIQFNLSHAGNVALIAVTRNRRIGVDVEPVRALPDADNIVERFFSAREVDVYRSLPRPARPEAFFTCWTRKEAFIKALGDGLTHALDAFDVTVRPDEPAALLRVRGAANPPPWHFEGLPVYPGYAATVAVEGGPCSVSCWDSTSVVELHTRKVLASA